MSTPLAHEIRGESPASVLLIHGWLTSRAVWGGVADLLAPSRGVLLPDLRGFGASEGEGAADLEANVNDLLDLLDELGLERVHLGGHSMGGAIAQLLAIEAPSRVASLTLVTPVPASGFPLPPEAYAQFESLGGAREALEGFFTPQFVNAQHVAPFVDIAMRASPTTAKNTLGAWTGCSFADRLAQIKVPTVVVCGAQDPFLTAEVLEPEVVGRIDGARLETLATGGHYVLVDDAPGVANILRRQLD
jgi:pimeloyl-ACP methyl ester carboxylesterase